MQNGWKRTLEVLTTTRNESAADVLSHALEVGDVPLQKRALDSLLSRRHPTSALRKIVVNWHTYSDELKQVACEHRGRLTRALRDAIVSRNDELCANGCDAAVITREYDIVPALLTVIRSNETRQVEMASRALIELTQVLHVELEYARDARARRGTQLSHAHVCSALETAVRQYPQHGRRDILTAFLNVAGRDNATLKRILREPLDAAHSAVVELLSQSPRPGIAQLVASFVEDVRAPQAALSILSRRRDDLFVENFLRTVGESPSGQARSNLARLSKIDWLQSAMSQLAFLDENAQVALANVIGHSGVPQDEICRVFREMLASGKLRARRVAAELLNEFQGVEANRLVMQALRDQDLHVQAAALGQLRGRGLPGAMATLIEALDSPHELLRETARNCLGEFDLPRYLHAYEGMNEEVRRNTGKLVSKVDGNAFALLAEEMQSISRSRRLRAIDVAQALSAVERLEEPLLALLSDDDYLIRAEAAEALAQCPTNKTRLALRNATLDDSPAVCMAAQRALEQMVVASSKSDSPPDAAYIQPPVKSKNMGGWSW